MPKLIFGNLHGHRRTAKSKQRQANVQPRESKVIDDIYKLRLT